MNHRSSTCSLCKTVKFVCFWGEMPVRPWKRLALTFVSLLTIVLFGVLGWYSNPEQDLGEYIAVALGVLVGVVGLSVAAVACDSCVARVFGRV